METPSPNEKPLSVGLQQADMPPPAAQAIVSTPGQNQTYRARHRSNLILHAEQRLRHLETENRKLKDLIDALKTDKLSQAQRIKELELEKDQLKNLFAEYFLKHSDFKPL